MSDPRPSCLPYMVPLLPLPLSFSSSPSPYPSTPLTHKRQRDEVKMDGDEDHPIELSTSPHPSPKTSKSFQNPMLDPISASDWTLETLVVHKIPSGNFILIVDLPFFFPTLSVVTNGVTTTTTRTIVAQTAVAAAASATSAAAAGAAATAAFVDPNPFSAILLHELNGLQIPQGRFRSQWDSTLSPNPIPAGHHVALEYAQCIANLMNQFGSFVDAPAPISSLLRTESNVDSLIYSLLTAFGFSKFPHHLIPQAPFPLFMNTMKVQKTLRANKNVTDVNLIENINSTPEAKAGFAILSHEVRSTIVVVDKKEGIRGGNFYPQVMAVAVAAAQFNMRTKVLMESITKDPFETPLRPSEYDAKQLETIYAMTVCGSVMEFYRVTFTWQTLMDISFHDTIPSDVSTVQKLRIRTNGNPTLREGYDIKRLDHREDLFTALHNLKAYADSIL